MAYTYRNSANGDTQAFDAARADLVASGHWTLIADDLDAAAVAAVAALNAARAAETAAAALRASVAAANVAAAQAAIGWGAPGGVAQLDSGSQVPAGELGNAKTAIGWGVASGSAKLDSGGQVPLNELGNVPADVITSVDGRTGVVVLGELYAPVAPAPRIVQPTTVLTTMQSGHGYTGTGTGGVFSLNDTADFISGSQAAKLTTGGTGAQTNIRKFAGSAFDTTGMVIRLRLKVDDITHLNELDFYVGSSSLGANYKWSFFITGGSANITSGEWCTVTLSFAVATATGSPTRSGLTDVQLQCFDDNTGNAVVVHLQSVELIADGSATWPNGVVSICFDDSWATARDNGFGRLDLYGFPATLFTITDVLGTTGRMSLTDLRTRCDRYGWESACHANTDANHSTTYTGLTAAALDADMRDQRRWALDNLQRDADGTAYPLGQFGKTSDAQLTADIVRRYFSYARGTAGSATRNRETYPPADRFRIRAISGISTFTGNACTPTQLTTTTTGVIDAAKTNAAWLVLVFHKVITGTVAATTEVTQTDFNAIIDKIQTAGMAVRTIGDVLRSAR